MAKLQASYVHTWEQFCFMDDRMKRYVEFILSFLFFASYLFPLSIWLYFKQEQKINFIHCGVFSIQLLKILCNILSVCLYLRIMICRVTIRASQKTTSHMVPFWFSRNSWYENPWKHMVFSAFKKYLIDLLNKKRIPELSPMPT